MMTSDTLSCEEALRLLAEYLDRELHADTEARIHRHLEVCRSCYSRAEFERRLKAQLGELGDGGVEPDFEGRIRSLVHAFRVQDGAPSRSTNTEEG